jgi:hypothetical protein
MNRCSSIRAWTGLSALTAALVAGTATFAHAQGFDLVGPYKNGQPLKELMSGNGFSALKAAADANGIGIFVAPGGEVGNEEKLTAQQDPGEIFGTGEPGNGEGGGHNNQFKNVFVNDPCMDPSPFAPFPENFRRTMQSETEIAVFNPVGKEGGDDEDDDRDRGGRLMVAGYNDSWGFYDNRQGLSGFSYSTNGGKLWIDASGLPPRVPSGVPAGTLGSDAYFGDPVVVVDNMSRKFTVGGSRIKQPAGTFYYASIYQNEAGIFTLSVNRGRFKVAPQQVPIESKANTRCQDNPALHGIPDPPAFVQERIIWEPPVAAVVPPFLGQNNDAFLDKEWLYVDQKTGFLYLTYTRFEVDGSTPIELVRSFDGGRTWTPPSVIVPNLLDTFNQATMPVVTPTGRVIVTWHARTFPEPTFVEREQRIEVAFSDNGGNTFGLPVVVTTVNPQREPPGYNRNRVSLLNAPYINVDKGRDDGKITQSERGQRGFGNVYITYFNGDTPFATPPNPNPPFARTGDIFLSTSRSDGTTWEPRVQVNDDNTLTSHVFPSVQVNRKGLVFVTWLDRRVDPARNLLTDTWGDISRSNQGPTLGDDVRITDVSTDWVVRTDGIPNFGDYNSSELIDFTDFVSIWADGRFPEPQPLPATPPFTRPSNRAATPDVIFAIFGDGSGGGHGHGDGKGGDD